MWVHFESLTYEPLNPEPRTVLFLMFHVKHLLPNTKLAEDLIQHVHFDIGPEDLAQ